MNIIMTPDQVRAEFDKYGISISSWAKENGYPSALVYQVLKGDKRCLRGMSHEIAVKLGLKIGEVGNLQTLADKLNSIKFNQPESALEQG